MRQVALLGIGRLSPHGSASAAVVMTALVALGLIGPYSYLAGSMAMDFGGRQGSALSSGLIDGVGYLGGVFPGDGMARLSIAFGWPNAFVVLAAVCLASALGPLGLFHVTRTSPRRAGSIMVADS